MTDAPQPDYSQSQPAQPGYPQPAYGQPAAVDPGRTLGIIGLVLAFLVNIAGLIVSIIALRTSKRAGFKNGIALAGIIVSIASIVIGIIAGIAVGVGISKVAEACKELGPGTHTVGTSTVTCPG